MLDGTMRKTHTTKMHTIPDAPLEIHHRTEPPEQSITLLDTYNVIKIAQNILNTDRPDIWMNVSFSFYLTRGGRHQVQSTCMSTTHRFYLGRRDGEWKAIEMFDEFEVRLNSDSRQGQTSTFHKY